MTQRELKEKIPPCPVCDGWPAVKYDPGCFFTVCPHGDKDCPRKCAVADYDPEGLVERLNEKEK